MTDLSARLSTTMRNALEFMESHNGLKRLPGGFWVGSDANGWQGETWFGTTTVNALVARNVAAFTEWQEGRNSRFPIKCERVK